MNIKVNFFVLYCRADSTVKEGKKGHGGKNSEDTTEKNVKDDTREKQSSKKKGKGKKGKKGKGRGKKSNREASDKDKAALREFLDSLKGTRRLMVRRFSFCILLSAFLPHLLTHSGTNVTNACNTSVICPYPHPSLSKVPVCVSSRS